MGKFLNASVMDASLNKIATGTILCICTEEPTSRNAAVSTYHLASVTLSAGDFTLANGDVGGRKVTVAQKTGIPITASGTATHIAICDASSLLLVTTCVHQPLISAGTVTNPAFKYEITNPV